jgi:aminoglycoside phosphotransferase (APT) family kinase protein
VIPERARGWVQDQLDTEVIAIEPVTGGRTDTISAVRLAVGGPLILRYMPAEQWGRIGPQHVAAEALGCRLMAGSGLPVPELIASDALGTVAGAPANLTTWLPGSVRLDATGPSAVDELARAAAVIHAVAVPAGELPQDYEFWAPADPEVPFWTEVPHLWRQAIEIFGQTPPSTPPGLVHRDFHPGNILWTGDRIAGVIDWAETSWGPPDLDVAHAMTNFAMLHDLDSAHAFAAAYRRHGGVVDEDPDASRFWWVSDILGFLPDPALHLTALLNTRPELVASVVRSRLDQCLASILDKPVASRD